MYLFLSQNMMKMHITNALLDTTSVQFWSSSCLPLGVSGTLAVFQRERERESAYYSTFFFLPQTMQNYFEHMVYTEFGISLVSIVATGVSISNANLQWSSKCDGRRSTEYLFRPAADLLSSVSSLSEDARQALQKCFQYQCNSESDKVKFCFISVSTNVQNFCNISGISSAGGLILILK